MNGAPPVRTFTTKDILTRLLTSLFGAQPVLVISQINTTNECRQCLNFLESKGFEVPKLGVDMLPEIITIQGDGRDSAISLCRQFPEIGWNSVEVWENGEMIFSLDEPQIPAGQQV